ncbi:MAG: hypothetical protein ACREAB_01610 [Blastocatellia bacterium]
MYGGSVAPAGAVGLRTMRGGSYSATPAKELTLLEIARHGLPWPGNPREVNAWRAKNFRYLWRGLWRVVIARLFGLANFYGQLSLAVIRRDGRILDYGLASLRVVTDTGVGFIVDAFQNIVELENMKFHGIGTGGTAEAAAQTALVTELTTEYNPNSTRATGSTTEGASANIYRTVGTNTVDATAAITEHGIFTQGATGGGVMLDRSLFSVVNLANGDSLQSTYDFTITSGG